MYGWNQTAYHGNLTLIVQKTEGLGLRARQDLRDEFAFCLESFPLSFNQFFAQVIEVRQTENAFLVPGIQNLELYIGRYYCGNFGHCQSMKIGSVRQDHHEPGDAFFGENFLENKLFTVPGSLSVHRFISRPRTLGFSLSVHGCCLMPRNCRIGCSASSRRQCLRRNCRMLDRIDRPLELVETEEFGQR